MALSIAHQTKAYLFAAWLAREADEANRVKRDTPVMVVLGNPPYAVSSSNKGDIVIGFILNIFVIFKSNTTSNIEVSS